MLRGMGNKGTLLLAVCFAQQALYAVAIDSMVQLLFGDGDEQLGQGRRGEGCGDVGGIVPCGGSFPVRQNLIDYP